MFRMTAGAENIWVCGGGEIYTAFLPCCSRCYLTRVDVGPPCDTWFPNIADDPAWTVLREQPADTDGTFRCQFVDYGSRPPKAF